MNDAAVVPGLMSGDAIFLFDHDDAQGGEAPRSFQSGSQAYNSGADDQQICFAISHRLGPAKPAIIRPGASRCHDVHHKGFALAPAAQ